MFRALCAHHQEVKLYYTTSGIITLSSGRPVHGFREDYFSLESSLNLRTGRPLTKCDDTRSFITQFLPPDDEHIVLETCRATQ